jgi:hypothetical protein
MLLAEGIKLLANITSVNDVRSICQLAETLLFLGGAAQRAFHRRSPDEGGRFGFMFLPKPRALDIPFAKLHVLPRRLQNCKFFCKLRAGRISRLI